MAVLNAIIIDVDTNFGAPCERTDEVVGGTGDGNNGVPPVSRTDTRDYAKGTTAVEKARRSF